MKTTVAAAAVVILLGATPASSHRLDEYLQATTMSLENERVRAEIRLVPGVAVFPVVFADIDRDADGVASGPEQRAYAERVLGDLLLSIDGKRLPLYLISSTFAPRETLQEGRGEIRLQFEADLPGRARTRRLTFENRHQSRIGSYLVNCLVPRDPDIEVTAQNRSFNQSLYQLDYADANAPASVLSLSVWPDAWAWLGSAAIGLIAGLVLLLRRGAPGPAR
jgi:hypothetical protein